MSASSSREARCGRCPLREANTTSPRAIRLTVIALLGVFSAAASYAQVAITNPGNTTPGLLSTYPTLADAITDLNAQTAISGPVVITLTGNETAPAGGYSITAPTTAIGASSTNTVTIEGNGSTITASAALTAGALNDAIFKLIGADYVTIQNFTMLENAANTTTTAASNNMTEWGVALLYASTTNGAQNCTIQNNTITLNRTYQNTFGVYSNSTHTATAVTVSATATGAAGGNSGLRVYGNNISNVNEGIVVVGPTAAADHNTGVDVGGSSLATGNTISNYGTTGTFSGYANVSGTVYGILVRNSIGYNISYNNITSSSGPSGVIAGTLRGIYVPSASNQPTGTFTNAVTNNTLSVTSHVVSGTLQGITVESTTSTTTSTTNIDNNNITTLTYSIAAASGTVTAISQSGSTSAGPLNHSISNNTFTNISAATTGSFTFISNSWARPTNGVGNVNNNSIVTGFSKTGAGGTVTLYTSNSTSGATITEINTGNNFSNITVTGATTLNGWRSTDGGTPMKTITNNTFSNWTGGTNQLTGLAVSFSGSATVSGNTVSNLNGAGAIVGMESTSGTQTFTQNTVQDLTATGTGAATGITVSGGTTQTFARNKICNISNTNAGGSVNGILISSGTTVNVRNNLIGELTAPAASGTDVIRGISITSTATAAIDVAYNTVYLDASSSGANFGTSGIFHTGSTSATTAALTMRNNAIINDSTAAGTGLVVAFRRSTGAAGTLANYAAASNYNDFFAGSPGPANLIYSDGTSTAQTMNDYQSGVFTAGTIAPRDTLSFSENPPFLSTTCGDADFLHVDTTIGTLLEGGGAPIAGITDDYDGDTRDASTPDVGADEFDGTPGAVGACCLPTGCIQTTESSCTIQGGTSWQQGVSCEDANCPRGACCLPQGGCQDDVFELECTVTLGGVYRGDYTSCDSVDPPCPPGGSCCAVDGTCSITTEENCSAPGEVWTLGGDCSSGTCVTGACCFADGSCAVRTVAGCEAEDGCYSGDGTVCASVIALTENFDGVTPPALPTDWVATNAAGAAPLWVTSNSGVLTPFFDSAPNSAFIDDPSAISDKRLDSPTIQVSAGGGSLTFRHNYAFEFSTPNFYDGGVLEISINGGAFADIIAAGGSFAAGGYNATISTGFSSPIAGRPAWGGTTSAAYITTTVNLPAAAAGQDVVLRWRMCSDTSVAGTGWRIDTISMTGTSCPDGPCDVRACCFADGHCEMLTQGDCSTAGGTPGAYGSSCDENPCPQPTGACCFTDGSCQTLTSADCITAGGSYQGNGSSCDPNPCAQPTGACCFTDGSCHTLTSADCITAGGSYQGNGSSCDPNPCPQPCTNAQRADSNCDGTVNNFDIDCFVFAVVGGTNDPSLWQGFGCQQNGCDFICVNDVNGDQAVDNFDIDSFVNCVINLGCP